MSMQVSYLVLQLSLADEAKPSFAKKLVLNDLQHSITTLLILSDQVPENLRERG